MPHYICESVVELIHSNDTFVTFFYNFLYVCEKYIFNIYILYNTTYKKVGKIHAKGVIQGTRYTVETERTDADKCEGQRR